jgi:formyl-CoA transferase/CoA:oxalate CoA-transferase
VIGRPELADDPRYRTNADRATRYEEVKAELERALQTRTRAEWVDELASAGVPCGSVREISEVLADPQIVAREMVREVEHTTVGAARVISSPVKMSGTPTSVRTAPPTLGQHTSSVLGELGYDEEQIVALKRARVI